MQIRVSVCTSVFNQSEMLKEMISSVVSQTFKGWELTIVDDGSTEDILSVVKSFDDGRIKYLRFDENKGIPHGVNFALKGALGEFVSILAADEEISPTKLEDQLEYLDNHPGVDCVWGAPGRGPFGPVEMWEMNALRAHNRSREQWLRTLVNLENVPIGAASLLMKREVIQSLGYMDEKLTLFSDHELYCRFFEKYVGVILPYRWAVDKDSKTPTVRQANAHKADEELAYVRSKHPLILPPATGKVTVGLPCYNQAKFLKDAVDSILAQTLKDIEFLILDDGSTDNFKEVASTFNDPRIKFLGFPENMGMWEAHNQMAFRAEGEFYVPMSADDILEPTALERLLAEFSKNPWLEFAATQTDFIKENKTPLTDNHPMLAIPKPINRTREEWIASLYAGNQYFGIGMYRTKAISEVGGWSKEFKVITDYEMYLKMLMRENIHVIEEPLMHTRVHGENASLLKSEDALQLPQLYHDARKPYYRKLMKVIIATPFYELKGFSPFIVSLTQTVRLLTACGIDWRFMELSGDSYVHRARNTMCDGFLRDPDATDLFFIDSDMSWNPEAFVKMCLLPDEVVGGSYPVKNGWDMWTSIPMMHEQDGVSHYKGRDLGDGTALIEAQVLAGGFLRLKRSVLERFKVKYPDLWYVEPTSDREHPDHKFAMFFAAESADHRFFGEDHMFSKRLREMGTTMFIYPNVDIHHFGIKGWHGNLDKFLKEKKLFPDRQVATQAVQ